jgi:hypothetical protein
MIGASRRLRGTYWPALIALGTIALVMLFLFAYPLVSAALGLALPFIAMAVMASMFLAINLRWSLWHGGRPLFFSIADIGFLVCLAAFALYGFAYVSDYGWNVLFVLLGFGILGMFRVAFIEFEAWWLGIVLCAILGLVFGAYIRLTLFEPEWFFDFGASLLLLTGLVLLLAGSVLSLLASAEASRREAWPGWLRAGAIALGIVLAVALGASAAVTIANRETVSASEASGLISATFESGRLEFSRELPDEGTVRLVVVNRDLRVHSLTADEIGVDVVIGPRSERIVEFEIRPGDYRSECRIPGHSEAGRIANR